MSKNLFILPNGLSKMYLNDLKKAAHRNNFKINDKFNLETIDVLITVLDDYEKILKLLKLEKNDLKFKIVNLKWLIDSNKYGKCLDVDDYLIKTNDELINENYNNQQSSEDLFQLPDYECQRVTKLEHFNKEFTDALEILEEYAEYRNSESDASRALAFRRGICVLRSLPKRITSVKELKNIKNIGEHTRNVIQEILDYGYSKEVDTIISQEYYQSVKIFNSIYGCGPTVSNRLYESGYRNINDLRKEQHNTLNKKIDHDFERFKYGLAYYEDLITPMKYEDALEIFEIIKKITLDIEKNCILDIVGGFRRGKQKGHDLDILITHPVSGEEKGLLARILDVLEEKGFVIFGKHDREADSDWAKPISKNIIDHFERFIGILRFHKKIEKKEASKRLKVIDEYSGFESQDKDLFNKILNDLNANKYERDWIARRVDIIICPIEQHAFALLGWTGSRQFNRSMRLYSEKEFNYRLTSHGIYDHINNLKIGANSEKEIFDIFKLKYLEPNERNC